MAFDVFDAVLVVLDEVGKTIDRIHRLNGALGQNFGTSVDPLAVFDQFHDFVVVTLLKGREIQEPFVDGHSLVLNITR